MAQQSEDIAAEIGAHADSLQPESFTLDSLKERLDKLELAIEQAGKSAELVAQVSEYLSDLRGEVRSIKFIRLCSVIGVALFVTAILGMLICLIFYHQFWFFVQGTYFRTAFFVTSMTAVVVLLSVLLKGAFRSISERHGDDPLPAPQRDHLSCQGRSTEINRPGVPAPSC